MNILSAENISKTLRDEPLFENATLGLNEGEKAGIVGKNGAGKSTLLKVIAGILQPDDGTVSTKNGLNVVYLAQNVSYEEGATVRSFLYEADSDAIRTIKEYEAETAAGRDASHLLERIQHEDLWGIERSYTGYLKTLGTDIGQDRKMSSLSGGEAKKAAIARALALRPELLLLDEPTNHLDIRSIEYLEDWISSSSSAVIIVTHDRHILTRCCSSIWELDRKRIYSHPGNFTSYLERREERYRMDEKEMQRILTILRREREWLLHGPKARTGKDKGRKDRINAMLSERVGKGDEAPRDFQSAERRLGKKILEIEGISKSYDGHILFSDFSFSFVKGQKIALIGDNGTGKSTLLDILSGHIDPDSGAIDRGQNTVFGYYDQLGRDLKDSRTVIEYAEDIGERVIMGSGEEVSTSRFLELFGFPARMQRTPIALLSGGERRRLYLITRLLSNPNFLLFDEPTNDLDIETMEKLEEYIVSFPGCAVISSHDRTFLDVTTDMTFVIEDQRITLFPGNYSEWKEAKEHIVIQKEDTPKKEQKRPQREYKGLTFKEEREKAALEEEISKLENLIGELEASFSTAETTELGTLAERTRRYEETKQLLDEKTERWIELEEKAGE